MLFNTIIFIDSVVSHLTSGKSVARAIESATLENRSEISIFANYYLQAYVKGESTQHLTSKISKPENKILFMILEQGLKGLPVLQTLEDFQKEVKFSNSIEIENFQRTLPFKLMIPLLFCYFPSLTLLFIGPFIVDFLKYSSVL